MEGKREEWPEGGGERGGKEEKTGGVVSDLPGGDDWIEGGLLSWKKEVAMRKREREMWRRLERRKERSGGEEKGRGRKEEEKKRRRGGWIGEV